MKAATRSIDPVVTHLAEDERIMLRLAGSPLGLARDIHYEDLAETYGDRHLFDVALRLRENGLLEWGSAWNRCWLTDEGERVVNALERR